MTFFKLITYILLLAQVSAGLASALSCNMEHTYTTPQGTTCRKAQHRGTRIVRDCGGFDGTTCDHLNPVTEPCPPGTYNPDEWHTRWQCLAKEKTCADVSVGRYGSDEQAYPGYRYCVELAGSKSPEPACGPAPNQYLYKTQLQWICLNITCPMCSGSQSQQFKTQCDYIRHTCTTTAIPSTSTSSPTLATSHSTSSKPQSTPSTPTPTSPTITSTSYVSHNRKNGVTGGGGGAGGLSRWLVWGFVLAILSVALAVAAGVTGGGGGAGGLSRGLVWGFVLAILIVALAVAAGSYIFMYYRLRQELLRIDRVINA